MKIVKVLGGLGNQMFQYAFYVGLSSKFDKVKLDLSDFADYSLHNGYELSRIFSIQEPTSSFWENNYLGGNNRNYISRILKKLFGLRKSYYEQSSPASFDSFVFKTKQNMYLWGYWQNEKYFKDVSPVIKEKFLFPKINDEANLSVLKKIKNTNSVGLHIRRGDYISHSLLGNICDVDYYRNSILYIKQQLKNPLFFVFSDDIQWCKDNLNTTVEEYIDWNTGLESYRDMQLMCQCKGLIIANSSFSWWAAWLNNRSEKIIVAPTKWFNNNCSSYNGIFIDSWVRI